MVLHHHRSPASGDLPGHTPVFGDLQKRDASILELLKIVIHGDETGIIVPGRAHLIRVIEIQSVLPLDINERPVFHRGQGDEIGIGDNIFEECAKDLVFSIS